MQWLRADVGQMLAGIAAGWQCDNPDAFLVGGWQAVFVIHGRSSSDLLLKVVSGRCL